MLTNCKNGPNSPQLPEFPSSAMTLLLPSRCGIYFPLPWIRAGPVTHFGPQNAAEMLRSEPSRDPKILNSVTHFLGTQLLPWVHTWDLLLTWRVRAEWSRANQPSGPSRECLRTSRDSKGTGNKTRGNPQNMRPETARLNSAICVFFSE